MCLEIVSGNSSLSLPEFTKFQISFKIILEKVSGKSPESFPESLPIWVKWPEKRNNQRTQESQSRIFEMSQSVKNIARKRWIICDQR